MEFDVKFGCVHFCEYIFFKGNVVKCILFFPFLDLTCFRMGISEKRSKEKVFVLFYLRL